MTFASDLRGWADKVNGGMTEITRQAVILAAQGLVMQSPVGNPDLWKVPRKGYVGGRFRGSWSLGIGSPDEATSGAIDPSGGATLAKIVGGMASQKAGNVFYVTSNLPYARPLEYGHSTQAPNGFVRITFAELPSALEAVASSLR